MGSVKGIVATFRDHSIRLVLERVDDSAPIWRFAHVDVYTACRKDGLLPRDLISLNRESMNILLGSQQGSPKPVTSLHELGIKSLKRADDNRLWMQNRALLVDLVIAPNYLARVCGLTEDVARELIAVMHERITKFTTTDQPPPPAPQEPPPQPEPESGAAMLHRVARDTEFISLQVAGFDTHRQDVYRFMQEQREFNKGLFEVLRLLAQPGPNQNPNQDARLNEIVEQTKRNAKAAWAAYKTMEELLQRRNGRA